MSKPKAILHRRTASYRCRWSYNAHWNICHEIIRIIHVSSTHSVQCVLHFYVCWSSLSVVIYVHLFLVMLLLFACCFFLLLRFALLEIVSPVRYFHFGLLLNYCIVVCFIYFVLISLLFARFVPFQFRLSLRPLLLSLLLLYFVVLWLVLFYLFIFFSRYHHGFEMKISRLHGVQCDRKIEWTCQTRIKRNVLVKTPGLDGSIIIHRRRPSKNVYIVDHLWIHIILLAVTPKTHFFSTF